MGGNIYSNEKASSIDDALTEFFKVLDGEE